MLLLRKERLQDSVSELPGILPKPAGGTLDQKAQAQKMQDERLKTEDRLRMPPTAQRLTPSRSRGLPVAADGVNRIGLERNHWRSHVGVR